MSATGFQRRRRLLAEQQNEEQAAKPKRRKRQAKAKAPEPVTDNEPISDTGEDAEPEPVEDAGER